MRRFLGSGDAGKTRRQDVITQLFWLIASVEVVLAIAFALRMRKVATPDLQPMHFALARSQRQDNWLVCAVIWIVLLSADSPVKPALSMAGALALGWLGQRTLHRLRSA